MSDRTPSGRAATALAEGRPPLHSVPDDARPDAPDPGTDSSLPPGGRGSWMVAALLVAALLVAGAIMMPGSGGGGGDAAAAPPRHVVAALPVWNLARGSSTVTAHAEEFGAASPSLYEVAPTGQVVPRPQPAGVSVPDALAALRKAGVPVVPIVSNTRDGAWDPQLIATVLHDAALVERHIESLVRLVLQQRFAGIDIDYEDLAPADRDAFSAFVTQLANALHAKGKTLTVDVFAKADDQGYDRRNLAQDYHALGKAADQVRLMAYDWHWETSAAGPIAPVDWVRDVLAYAVTQIPPRKILLGVPTYGYGWVGQSGQLVSWLQAYATAETHGVPVHWDAVSESPWLIYRDEQGLDRTVWFENAYSIKVKLELAQSYRIGGVFLWLVGDEDDGMWPVVEAYGGGADMRDVQAP